MRGHSTPGELDQLEALESLVGAGSASIDDLITLGLLYMEPAHEEDRSIKCFAEVLQRAPGNALARIWLAYVLQQYDMRPEALRRGLELVRPLCEPGAPQRGAALILSVLITRDLGEASVADSIAKLEQSTVVEPAWVSNRILLVGYYDTLENTDEVLRQIDLAMPNLVAIDPAWGVQKMNYEIFITWRASNSSADWLVRERRALVETGHLTRRQP